jgi:hypothetical protein
MDWVALNQERAAEAVAKEQAKEAELVSREERQ